MLVTRQGDRNFVKVLDFGFAKVAHGMPEPGRGRPADALSRQGMVLGTPRYMAPEQCVGGTVDVRTDLYALGLILYEMLTGTSPFPDADSLKTIRHQISTPTPRMSVMAPGVPIPASLEALVMRLTEKLPDKRYATATELQTALAEVMEREGIAPPEPSAPLPASPSRPGSKESGGTVPTLASMDVVAADAPPASLRLAVNESQILSEKNAQNPLSQEATQRVQLSPTAGGRKPAVIQDQKTAVLAVNLRGGQASGLSRRIKERLPASLRPIPLPVLALAAVSLVGLILVLLLRTP